jgi:hypothetical protein
MDGARTGAGLSPSDQPGWAVCDYAEAKVEIFAVELSATVLGDMRGRYPTSARMAVCAH